MKKFLKNSLFTFLLLSLILAPSKAEAFGNKVKEVSCNKSICQLRMAERKLWIDHVLWTRSCLLYTSYKKYV